MKSILLVGAGGHCSSCIDVVESGGEYKIAGLVDSVSDVGSQCFGYSVMGADADLPDLVSKYKSALITVGQIKTPDVRKSLHGILLELNASLPIIVSSRAHVSSSAALGPGTIVMHDALVNAFSSIGENCIVNSKALIEHECVVGSHCHIATGAILNGGVNVGSGSFVGSGCVIREGVKIGANSVVGAGVVVLNDLPASTVLKASP